MSEESELLLRRYYNHLKTAEGGFVNHPDDPGGETVGGFTRKTMQRLGLEEDFERMKDIAIRLAKDQLFLLDKEYQELHAKALTAYLAALPHDVLYPSYALTLWMHEVSFMSSPITAVKMAQRIHNDLYPKVPLVVDGIWGPKTKEALQKIQDSQTLISYIGSRRISYLAQLPHASSFLTGWKNRVAKLQTICLDELESGGTAAWDPKEVGTVLRSS